MIVILMRGATRLDPDLVSDGFRAVAAAHPKALFISGDCRFHEQGLRLAADAGLETFRLTALYDPEIIFGPCKANWLLNEHARLNGGDSLVGTYHKFACQLQGVIEAWPGRTLVLYFDLLMLEMAMAFLAGQGLSLLRVFSLYLDEQALAIFTRASFGEGGQWALLKSNVKPVDAFFAKPPLRLVT
ncbi:hypothetical protein DLD99_13430 [Pseudomonas kribbensis]|uniref:Uncharacterized protein n=1 Tax=Pseudomonas kribbensis TaxID=1628086 RepID=A0A345RQ63_9PSED|nr:hypothetical protein [Pseudomonas kribbensis]AXI61429.1 hypothetical protein DLD99_13430 [Pseudomonas kribbensis]